jgi:hypothetical protein
MFTSLTSVLSRTATAARHFGARAFARVRDVAGVITTSARQLACSPAAIGVLTVGALFLLMSGDAMAQSVTFASLPSKAAAICANIGRAILIIGGTVVGAKGAMGSHETGKAATTFLIGGAFLIFAGAAPETLWNMMKDLFN